MFFFVLGIELLLLLLVLLGLLGIAAAWSRWSRVRRQVFGVNRSWRMVGCSSYLSGYDVIALKGVGLVGRSNERFALVV